ncbi:PTS sugar transporter subunit IIA [Vibrio sp. M60_M31a]
MRQQLVELGYAEPEYVDAMFDREALVPAANGDLSGYTARLKRKIALKTGIVICQYPWYQFTEDEDDVAALVIGIAAKNDEHIEVITTITNAYLMSQKQLRS